MDEKPQLSFFHHNHDSFVDQNVHFKRTAVLPIRANILFVSDFSRIIAVFTIHEYQRPFPVKPCITVKHPLTVVL